MYAALPGPAHTLYISLHKQESLSAGLLCFYNTSCIITSLLETAHG